MRGELCDMMHGTEIVGGDQWTGQSMLAWKICQDNKRMLDVVYWGIITFMLGKSNVVYGQRNVHIVEQECAYRGIGTFT